MKVAIFRCLAFLAFFAVIAFSCLDPARALRHSLSQRLDCSGPLRSCDDVVRSVNCTDTSSKKVVDGLVLYMCYSYDIRIRTDTKIANPSAAAKMVATVTRTNRNFLGSSRLSFSLSKAHIRYSQSSLCIRSRAIRLP